MICKECQNECMVDHVEDGKAVYACTNKNCKNYKKAFTEDGDASEIEIKDKTAI